MNIFFTGATGFIGRVTVAYLQGKGHSVTALVRDTTKARSLLGQGVEIFDSTIDKEQLVQLLEHTDAVVNLAGNPIATRWTDSKKASFRASRIDVTKTLVDAILRCETPPKILVSGSAVGYYGSRGDEPITEKTKKGEGFLSELCKEWENTALKAEKNGTRVCILRIGMVLGREGGILQSLAPIFEMNVGVYIGSGQYISWIHITDMVEIIESCIKDNSLKGPINCTAPSPITNKEFAIALQEITNSKFLIKIPSLLVKPFLGEVTTALTSSQKALPKVLEANGFRFNFAELKNALATELKYENIFIENYQWNHSDTNSPEEKYEINKKGQYQLTTQVLLHRDSKTIFEFFSAPLNLDLLTPNWVDFRVIAIPDRVQVGSYIQYRIGLWFIGFQWLTKIIRWEPNNRFIDIQEKGPYKLWWHEHLITQNSDGSILMKDRVIYRIPFGIIGRLIHKLLIRRTLLRIFSFRGKIIRLRFG